MRKLKINIILVSTALLMLGFSCSETGKEEMEKKKKMEWEKPEGFPDCPEDNTFATIAKIKKLSDDCYVLMVNENRQFEKSSQIKKPMLVSYPCDLPNEFKKDGLKVYMEYCKTLYGIKPGLPCIYVTTLKDSDYITIRKIKEL